MGLSGSHFKGLRWGWTVSLFALCARFSSARAGRAKSGGLSQRGLASQAPNVKRSTTLVTPGVPQAE